MLTNGKITQTKFSSFAELAQAVQKADAEKAANLRKTLPARTANAKRRSQKAGVVR